MLPALLAAVVFAEVPAVGPPRPADDPAAAAVAAKLNFQGGPEERRLFEALVSQLLQSPTLAELAARFAAQPGPVETDFADFPGTSVYERREGRLSFEGKVSAHVTRSAERARISLNRACFKVDPEYALELCTRHLAHEALGHSLGWLEAGPAGVREAYVFFDDEFFAQLVGWTLDAELGRRVIDPAAWCALNEPERYQRRLSRTYPSSMDAASYPAEIRRVEASSVGPAMSARALSLRHALLAKPESFFAVDDCSEYLD